LDSGKTCNCITHILIIYTNNRQKSTYNSITYTDVHLKNDKAAKTMYTLIHRAPSKQLEITIINIDIPFQVKIYSHVIILYDYA